MDKNVLLEPFVDEKNEKHIKLGLSSEKEQVIKFGGQETIQK